MNVSRCPTRLFLWEWRVGISLVYGCTTYSTRRALASPSNIPAAPRLGSLSLALH